jgi:hypothetical protein
MFPRKKAGTLRKSLDFVGEPLTTDVAVGPDGYLYFHGWAERPAGFIVVWKAQQPT